MLDALFWWVGATVCGLSLIYGLSALAMFAFDRAIRHFGLWPEFARALRIMYRAKREASDAG